MEVTHKKGNAQRCLVQGANPSLGFDLTAEEYQQLSGRYQQGYQAQAPRRPTNSAMPKEASPWDRDEQPQAHYPQMPPMAT